MKVFKIADCWISVILIAACTIFVLLRSIDERGITIIISYTIIGSWQLISMLVHAITGNFTKKWGTRYVYHWISFIAVITMPAGSVWVLAFAAPVMAIFYTCLCYSEIFKMKRPLELLK